MAEKDVTMATSNDAVVEDEPPSSSSPLHPSQQQQPEEGQEIITNDTEDNIEVIVPTPALVETESDDADTSFVPESLKNFFEEADKKLELDLAGFLSPLSTNKQKANQKENEEDYTPDIDNEKLKQDLLNAKVEVKQGEEKRDEIEEVTATTPPPRPTISPQQQEQHAQPRQDPTPETDKKDTDNALLDIINPAAQVTNSEVKRIAMSSSSDSRSQKQEKSLASPDPNSQSASPSKHVERKLQKELDQEAKRASIESVSSSSTSSWGLRRRSNKVAPVLDPPEVKLGTGASTDKKASSSKKKSPPQKTFVYQSSIPSPDTKGSTNKKEKTETKKSKIPSPTKTSPQFVYEPTSTGKQSNSSNSASKSTSPAAAFLKPKEQSSPKHDPFPGDGSERQNTDGQGKQQLTPNSLSLDGAPAVLPQTKSLQQQKAATGNNDDQVFTMQGPILVQGTYNLPNIGSQSHSKATREDPNILPPDLDRSTLNEDVFTVQGPAPASKHEPVEQMASKTQARTKEQYIREQNLLALKNAAAKLKTSSQPVKPFKAKPAPTPPKPKEIAFPAPLSPGRDGTNGDSSKINPSDAPVSPLAGDNLREDIHPSANIAPPTLRPSISGNSASPLHPRLLEPTVSSMVSASRRSSQNPKPVPEQFSGRRPLTRPDKNIERLLRPTTASTAFKIKDSKQSPTYTANTEIAPNRKIGKGRITMSAPLSSNDRLLKPTQAAIARSLKTTDSSSGNANKKHTVMSEEERKQAKIRLRARILAMEKNSKPKQLTAAQEQKKREKDEKLKEAVKRTRESRGRLQRMEQERLNKLNAKIMAKDARSQRIEQKKQELQQLKDIREQKERTARLSDTHKRPPTIPIAPTFATDQRLTKKDIIAGSPREEILPLAASTDILMRGLRAPTPSSTSSNRRRRLTIPQAPKFATSQRHGEKSSLGSPQRKKEISDDISWFSTLRDGNVSPISKAASSVKSGPLTIPQTPHFQPIRQRPLPKSTAEKEQEEIEYYRNHPFRARPVKMNPLPPASLKRKELTAPPRPLTTPEPFQFRTEARSGRSHHQHEDEGIETGQFKARPMPNFASNRISRSTGCPSRVQKQVTTPEPFHFHTKDRAAIHSPETAENIHDETGKSRKIPSGAAGLQFRRTPARWSPASGVMRPTASFEYKHNPPSPPSEIKPFKAKPMPTFIPKTIRVSTTDEAPVETSADSRLEKLKQSILEEEEVRPFRARPMPNFDRVSIPVQHTEISRILSPTMTFSESEEPRISPGFHARPVPRSLTKQPSIPVKDRNPRKLRSPDGIKRSSPPPKKETSPTFHARPIPSSLSDEPAIPVKYRNASNLRSPENTGHPRSSWQEANLLDREDAKARLKQRLALRKAVQKTQTKRTESSKSPADKFSPKAFTSSKVKERLSRGNIDVTRNENRKLAGNSPDVPGTISLPIKSPKSDKHRQNAEKVDQTPSKEETKVQQGLAHASDEFWDDSELGLDVPTPRAGNAKISQFMEKANTAEAGGNVHRTPEREAELLREATLACALGQADEDETESVLQLAREIQRAAEDELSFHGSLDTRERMAASLSSSPSKQAD